MKPNRVRWLPVAAPALLLSVLLSALLALPALAQATPGTPPAAAAQATVSATGAATVAASGAEQGAGSAGAERAACGATVTVQQGDTLNRIARRCGTTVAEILKANPEVKNPSRIFVGQTLRLPGGGTQPPPGGQTVYTVVRGDTLSSIARRFGVTPAAILKANPAITNPSTIYVGQRIVIPGSGAPATPAPRPTGSPTARPTGQPVPKPTAQPGPQPGPQPSPQPTPGGSATTKIYLVALNDKTQPGGAIGCGDGIVPVTVAIQPTQAILRASLEALLAQKDAYYGESGLYNALHTSSLKVDGVSIVDGEARIALSGQVVLGGACDAPRVQAQLERTATQFSTVNRVAITVNGRPLAEVLSSK